MTPTDTDRRLAEIHARLQAAPTMTGPGGTLTDAHCAVLNNAHADLAWLLSLVQALARPTTTSRVLAEIAAERAAQDQKWGEQNHPWHVPGLSAESVRHELRIPSSTEARDYVQALADYGILSYSAILLEEVCEAVDESDDALARHELIQVAAVAVGAVEAIDRRAVPARLADDERHLADILRRPSPPSSPPPPAAPAGSAPAGSEGGHGGERYPVGQWIEAVSEIPPRPRPRQLRPCPDCRPGREVARCTTCGGNGCVVAP